MHEEGADPALVDMPRRSRASLILTALVDSAHGDGLSAPMPDNQRPQERSLANLMMGLCAASTLPWT
jgi:hypothetical protein